MFTILRSSLKKILATTLLLLCLFVAKSQIALYPLMTSGSNPPVGTTSVASPNVTAGTLALNTSFTPSYSSSGLKLKQSAQWPTSPTDPFSFDIPLSPNANFFFTLSSLSLTINTAAISTGANAPTLFIIPMFQVDGAGSWTPIGTPQSTVAATVLNFGVTPTQRFYNHTYVFRFYIYGTAASTKSQYITIQNITFDGLVTTLPVVHTTGLTSQPTVGANFSANATGTYTTGTGIQAVNQSGFCWASTPTVPSLTNNIKALTGTNSFGVTTLNYNINPLAVGTVYNVRAYAITATDTLFGETLIVKAQDSATVTTNTITNILSNKATSGGVIVDSGSVPILEKGVCWILSPGVPTYTNSHTSDGSNSNPYTSLMKNLLPNTTYCARAYARNSVGIGYGNLVCFTTSAPVPSITAVPGILDFGSVTYNTTAPVLSYKLNATYLAPAAGSLTINASAGYNICTTLNGVYGSTLSLPYTGSTITNKIIYVKSSSTPYGALAGKILHTGGGVVAPNADTVFVTTNVIQNTDTLSNMGNDFWTGFAYENAMKSATKQFDTIVGSAKGTHMSIYIAGGLQADSVIIELPGIPNALTFPRRVYVPANGFVEVGGFPVGEVANVDSRLYYTGISNRAIHIYSKSGVPVSCWLYDWETSNSAAGAMLFPSNTWNSSYIVQAMGGKANNNGYNNNSFFFVIAKDDNTPVTFKPTNDILDSNANTIFTNGHLHTPAYVKYQKDSTYTITLNKGQVFNAMGFVGNPDPSSSDPGALDLSGTLVSTTCDKKIAVFGGNGRCVLGTANTHPTAGNSSCTNPSDGSDNLIQQMFPKVAWGTKYLTVPTKNMADNLFRVYVQDVTTKVWLNNNLLSATNLVNNLYYQFDINKPSKVEADKPISVTQFIVSKGCTNGTYGNIGVGDPEMITLSPVQQSIRNTTVYSSIFKNGNAIPSNGCSYINVVVKGADGVSSFKYDGLTSGIDTGGNTFTGAIYASAPAINISNAFQKHPFDTGYYYATFRVASKVKHTLSSSQGFNAIAYGVSDGESYGYNAGTSINNLSAVKFSINPNGSDTSTGSVITCKGNLVTLQIALPYDTTTVNSITWDPGADNTLYAPTGSQAGAVNPNTAKPLCVGTIVKDGRTFYIYKSPVQYTFFEEGAYKVKVTLNGTFASDCGGTDVENINVIVGHDDISFTATPGACGTTTTLIADNSTPLAGTSLLKWIWDFGDNSAKDTLPNGTSAGSNPTINPHTYLANTAYTIKLTTINSVGCFTTDSIVVNLAYSISTSFTQSQDTICPNGSVVFTPTSSAAAVKWFWDFGDLSPIDSSNTVANPVSHQYTTQGTYIVKHWVKTAAGCPSGTVQDTVIVIHQPIANFVLPSGVCLPGSTLFTNTSDTNFLSLTMPYIYHWDFGDAGNADTSNLTNPSYSYPNQALPSGGYIVSLTATNRFGCVSLVHTDNLLKVYPKPTSIIANSSDKKDCVGSKANFYDGSTATNQTINAWHWNFGDGAGTSTVKNPQYTFTSNKLDTVTLYIETVEGCRSDTATWTIKVNPKPVSATILPSSCITSGALFFQDNSTVAADDSIQTPYSYTWTFGDATGTFTTKDSSHTYAGVGTYYINHSITTLNGCTDIKIDTFKISGSKPIPSFIIPNRLGLCSNVDVTLIDTSSVAIGAIQKVEIRWDAINNYAAIQTDLSPSNGAAGSSKTYTHTYPKLPTTQTYFIRLYAYSGSTCMDSLEKSVTVYGSPKVVFNTIKGVCVNGSPRYIHLAHDSSGHWDNSLITNYYYSGTTVVADTFYPAIAGVGTYNIKAVYETKVPFTHCRDTAVAPITVWSLPTPSFTTSTPLCEGSSVTFTDYSTAGAGTGNISSWSWDFGDVVSGTSDTSSKRNPTHNYSAYNTYNVTLKATSDSGCSTTLAPQAITIHPKPQVGFLSPLGVCQGKPSVFTDTSKIADGTTSDFKHNWNFGDPTSSSNTVSGTYNPTPSHQYSGGPTDTIRLIVTSKFGCIDSAKAPVNNSITFPPITPTYLINGQLWDTTKTKGVCLNSPLKFTSGFKANDYSWSFGDSVGIINKGITINHTFPNVNTFTGSFSMIDSNGCPTKAVPININVWALPNPIIKVVNPTCEKNSITFIDGSSTGAGSGGVDSLIWNFGDVINNTAIGTPVNHTYNTANSYSVTLIVTSDSGCKATSPSPTIINVHPNPTVKFGLPTSVCLPLAAQFNDSTTISDGSSPVAYLWNFGDPASGIFNNTSTLPNPKHIFTVSSNDTIKLTITSNNGCIDSAKNILSASAIHNQPKANYSVNNANHDAPRVCLGDDLIFKDSSGNNTATSYWKWNDFTSDQTGSPILHTYPAGTFISEHYIIDNFGCRSDTISFFPIIDTFPTFNKNTSTQYILSGSSAILTPDISGGNTYLWTTALSQTYLNLNNIPTPVCTPPLGDSIIVYKIDVTGDGVCPAISFFYTVRIFTEPVIPNVFSPNGDGINDYWDITSLQYFAGANVQVFNRYGQIVLSRMGYARPWDGNDANGKPLPVGTYYYIIQLGNGFAAKSGSITILR